MKRILALSLFAAALTGAGCATQPTTASAESGGEVYTGSRIPRKNAEGSGVQTIEGATYKQDMERGMPQINPKGG